MFSIVMFLLVGACSGPQFQEVRALSLAEEVERLAGVRNYWPGFDPMTIPLAVYDGKRTYLFRHPGMPRGFAEAEGGGHGVLAYEGRHPAITANSSADIGGTMTATLLLDGSSSERSLTALAAVALHEAFHVYQRESHPEWAANEADLFVYPIDDPGLLTLRRLETEALRRALAKAGSTESQCWAGQALAFRAERFAEMDAAFAAYERGTELNEGLAAYVQLLAEGQQTVTLPADGFGVTDIRIRAYTTGPAFALLLDLFNEDWRESFEADDRQNLDQALLAELEAGHRDSSDQCEFSDAEIAESGRVALSDVAAVLAGQIERREKFDARPGWRVVVQAAHGEPLWPQGFDPLNVERVQGGILHQRFLRLGNDSGHLEAMDAGETDVEALTIGVGPHPLFNGIRQVLIAGLARPDVTVDDAHVSIRMPGLEANFERASVHRNTGELVVRLKPTE
jgi:hypothetical protein